MILDSNIANNFASGQNILSIALTEPWPISRSPYLFLSVTETIIQVMKRKDL